MKQGLSHKIGTLFIISARHKRIYICVKTSCMYIMVKTISGILLNTIKYHYILRQYIYDGGGKGQKPNELQWDQMGSLLPNQFTDQPRIQVRFTGTYRYSVCSLLQCAAGTFCDVKCKVLMTQCDISRYRFSVGSLLQCSAGTFVHVLTIYMCV